MKKLIFAMVAVCLTLNTHAQKINTEAITRFWQLVDYLKTDKTLTDSVWDAYYNLDANKTYMIKNRSDAEALEHRKYLQLVFRPSLANSLKRVAAVKNKNVEDNIFQNLYFIKLHEDELRKYSKEIQAPDYLKTCIALAKKHLPLNSYNPIPHNLTMYLMAITYDAAVQDSSMYFGLACLYDFDRFQKGAIVAHELHHLVRKENLKKISLSNRDSASLSIINQINNEGCADLIDKPIVFENETKLALGTIFKDWLMNSAEVTLKKVDSCLILNSETKSTFTTEEEFGKLTSNSSGHIPGCYMSGIIKKNGYMQELINNNGNPFNFFYLYNKAAKKDVAKPPLYSEVTIKYLRQLESKLIQH